MTKKMWQLIKQYIDARIDQRNGDHGDDYLRVLELDHEIEEMCIYDTIVKGDET